MPSHFKKSFLISVGVLSLYIVYIYYIELVTINSIPKFEVSIVGISLELLEFPKNLCHT